MYSLMYVYRFLCTTCIGMFRGPVLRGPLVIGLLRCPSLASFGRMLITYICMYIYIYIYIFTYIYIYICICIYMYVYVHIYI